MALLCDVPSGDRRATPRVNWRRSEQARFEAPVVAAAPAAPLRTAATRQATEYNNYCYEDHPADVRVRARGALADCLAGLAIGTHGYMTDLARVECREERQIIADASTLEQLVFNFVNAVFELYCHEYFIVKAIAVNYLEATDGEFHAEAVCAGERFDSQKHTQGTEVKAITKHDLTIAGKGSHMDICMLIDI